MLGLIFDPSLVMDGLWCWTYLGCGIRFLCELENAAKELKREWWHLVMGLWCGSRVVLSKMIKMIHVVEPMFDQSL